MDDSTDGIAGLLPKLLPLLHELRAVGEVDDAVRLLQVIEEVLGATADSTDARILLGLVEPYLSGGSGPALSALDAARALFVAEDDRYGAAACDAFAAEVLAARGDETDAIRWYRRALDGLSPEAQPGLVGRAAFNLSLSLRRAGDLDAALEAVTTAREAYRRAGMVRETADCHVGVALCLMEAGGCEQVLAPLAWARQLAVEFGLADLVADVDDRRGHALCELGLYEESAAAHAAAAEGYRRLGQDLLAARSDRYRSHPLDHLGHHEEVLSVLAAARQIFTAHDDAYGVALCDASSGAALLAMDSRPAAAAVLNSARDRLLELGAADEAAWCVDLLVGDALSHEHGTRSEQD